MAANSLLYLLLSTGLTTIPPDQSRTTDSDFDVTYRPPEDAAQWPDMGRIQDIPARWRHKGRYSTEDPSHQYPASRVTEDHEYTSDDAARTKWPSYRGRIQDEIIRWRQDPGYSTEYPGQQFTAPPVTMNEHDEVTHRPHFPDEVTHRPHFPDEVTHRPHLPDETETENPVWRSHTKGKRKCPRREHFTKCHKNCEKTCSDHMNPKPCPKSCKKGCVCDAGLVRNKEGRCVPRDQCRKTAMAEVYGSYGCPDYEYLCHYYCTTIGKRGGKCDGSDCECFE